MWGQGYILGIGVAFILYLWVRRIDRRYYKRKRELIQRRLRQAEARKAKHSVKKKAGLSSDPQE